jgi:hypothetical protein
MNMSLLILVGFVALCLAALYASVIFLCMLYVELFYGDEIGPVTVVPGCVAAALWYAAWWLSPFTITVSVST